MGVSINAVLDKHAKKTKKEFTLTGKVVSVIGPRVVVEVGGQRYDAINTRSAISVGDNCTISRGTNNRMWRVGEVFNDPLRGGSMSRQDMFGSGELPAVVAETVYGTTGVNYSAATLGTWLDLCDPLYITIRRPRLLAHISLDIRSTHTTGRTEFQFRFSVDDDTYFSPVSGNTWMHGLSVGNYNQNVTFQMPVVGLPVGLREVTPQVFTALSNGSHTGSLRVTSFYLAEF